MSESLKEKIPTVKVQIKDEYDTDFELEIYKWITDEEEASFQIIQFGDLEISEENKNRKPTIDSLYKVKEAKYRAYVKNLSWEEYSIKHPEIREKIFEEINKVADKKK